MHQTTRKILRWILIILVAVILILLTARLFGKAVNSRTPDGGINETMYVDINGTKQDGDKLGFKRPLPEDNFEIVIEFDGTLRGRIMDLAVGEEYTNYRREGTTGYSAGIRQKYIDLLLEIREKCCRNQYFKGEQARRICEYIYCC